MVKEYKLKEEQPNVDAVLLERNMGSIAEVMSFIYGESFEYDPMKFPDNEGLLVNTLGGQEKMLYGDTLVKDLNGNLSIQWTSIFNDLYEEVTNG